MTTAWWETRWLLSATAWTLAGLGALTFLWAMCRDRSRGRTRCPKCWYDLAGLVKPETPAPWPITCPECGKKIEHERQTRRTQRHWRLAALVLTVMLAAYPIAHIADAREFGPQRLLPLWLQAVAWPVGELDGDRFANPQVGTRIGTGNGLDIIEQIKTEAPDSWYARHFAGRIARSMKFSEPGMSARVLDFGHLWPLLRRGAPWYTEEEAKAQERIQGGPKQGRGRPFWRTKREWIAYETESFGYMLRSSVASSVKGDTGQQNDLVIGSSIVVAASDLRLGFFDKYHAVVERVIARGPGAREDFILRDGRLLVFRNTSDVADYGDMAALDLDSVFPITRIDGSTDVACLRDGSNSVTCVAANPIVQRLFDAHLIGVRARHAVKMAAEAPRPHNE
ncbi:MAG: hypothetical protein U0638_13000 [Phycisphaerales bacterium]